MVSPEEKLTGGPMFGPDWFAFRLLPELANEPLLSEKVVDELSVMLFCRPVDCEKPQL